MSRRHFAPTIAALAGLLVGSVTAVAAEQQPVSLDQLIELSNEQVGESVLSALIEARGVSDSVGPDEILALKGAGLSDEFIAELIASSGARSVHGAAGPDGGITYEERDGVLVVRGRGQPGPAVVPAAPSAPAPVAPPQVVVVPPAPVVVGNAAPAAPPQVVYVGGDSGFERRSSNANPYPSGAAFGYSGGAVSLPARFGEPASSFGRTIVFPPGRLAGYIDGYHGGHRAHHHGPLSFDHHDHLHDRGHGADASGVAGGLVGVPYPRDGRPGTRLLGIRTSRGVIHVPN